MKPVPVISLERWAVVAEQIRQNRLPAVIIKAVSGNDIERWSARHFAEVYPNKQVQITVGLPPHGVPYRERSGPHLRSISMRELLNLLESGTLCYLNQVPVQTFTEFQRDLDLSHLHLGRIFSVNLWIGGKTRSGLHYDSADNLFLQIFGTKRAILISPAHHRCLYPFADCPTKSQVDPESHDTSRYPLFKRCELWGCDLAPGDGLYIPRGWWHFIAAADVSVSVNCWHGNTLTEPERRRLFLAGGPKVVLRAAWDFVWHGVLGRSHERRLFSAQPPGLQAYERLKRRWPFRNL
jgi:hypothetical protein